MRKLSKRQPSPTKLSKRSKQDIDKFILEMKRRVKEDPSVIEKFKEYDVPVSGIDDIHVEFCELDVSAKTKDKKIYLNEAMLEDDSSVQDPAAYLAHEAIHWAQQTSGNADVHNKVDDYLHKPTEQSAFSVQIDFKERNEGEEAAEEYLSDLLDHHGKSGKERGKLKKKLKDE